MLDGDQSDEPTARSRIAALLAVAIALLGVVVRCAPHRGVLRDGEVFFLGVDPYYHLRRAQLIIEQFPAIPKHDALLSFPWGSSINWPPAFDLLLALPGLFGAPWSAVEVWAALVPPLLGGLGVYLTYRLGRHLGGDACGLLAAALFAVMPGAAESGLIGRADHHVLVAPTTLAQLLTMVACVRASSRRSAWAWGLACGACAALGVAGWVITPPLYFLVVPATLVLLIVTAPSDAALRAARACLGASLALVVLAVLVVADLERKPFDLYQPSLFIILPYLLALLVGLLTHLPRRHALVGVAGIAAVLTAAVVLAPALRTPVAEALAVARGRDPTYLMLLESRSPLFSEGIFTLEALTRDFSALALLTPAIWLLLLLRAWRRRDVVTIALVLYTMLGMPLLLLQRRFAEFTSPALALVIAWALIAGVARLRALAPQLGGPRRSGLWIAATLAAAVGALAPLTLTPSRLAAQDFTFHQRQLLPFARRVATMMPPPLDATGAPAYGVLTSWLDAHPVLYASGRATTVSPFGTREGAAANRFGFGVLLGAQEEPAAAALLAHRVRYLVLSTIIGQVKGMSAIAELDGPPLEEVSAAMDGALTFTYHPRFFDTLHARLYLAGGQANQLGGQGRPALSRFRMLLESAEVVDQLGHATPLLRAFEVVAGARLVGEAAPGQLVQLELPLRGERGRSWRYTREVSAGEDGRFELVVPYPSVATVSPIVPTGSYRLRCGAASVEVVVSERAVQAGERVDVPSLLGSGIL